MDKIGAIFDLYPRIIMAAYADLSLSDIYMMCVDFNKLAESEGIDLRIDPDKIRENIEQMAVRP